MEFDELGKQLVTTLAFTGVGLVVFALAFWLMELIAPFSIRKEIEEDQNNSLAIVMASIILGISGIIMAALLG